MKINKVQLVGMLVAAGFKNAPEWDNETLLKRIPQVPEHIEIKDVPEEFHAVYNKIKTANGSGDDFQLEEAAAGDKKENKDVKEPKGKKTSAIDKAVDRAAKKGKGKDNAKQPAAKGKATKEAKPKKEKAPKKERDRDAFGATVGSNRAKINAALTKDWLSDDELAEAAGVKPKQVRVRCRRLAKDKVIEVRRRVEYRLVDKKK